MTIAIAGSAFATETTILTFNTVAPANVQPVITFDPTGNYVSHPGGAGFNQGKIFASNSANYRADSVDFTVLSTLHTGTFWFEAYWDNNNQATARNDVAAGAYQLNFIGGYMRFEDLPVGTGTIWAEGNFASGYLLVNGNDLSFHVTPTSWSNTYAPGILPSGDDLFNMNFSVIDESANPGAFAGNAFTYSGFSGKGANGTLTSYPVPEPGEWAAMGILASGLTGLMVKARRRK